MVFSAQISKHFSDMTPLTQDLTGAGSAGISDQIFPCPGLLDKVLR